MYLVREQGNKGENDWLTFSNTALDYENNSGFILSLNGDANLHELLANPINKFLSVGRSGELLLITRINLKKERQSDYLEIKMNFLGTGEPITLIRNPYIPRN